MKLGTKGRYAVMALVDIAYYGQEGPLPLNEIAQRQRLPLPYLEQLFVKLRRKGMVESTRGQAGGYTLAKAAKDIYVADIFAAIDEPIQTTRCRPSLINSCMGGKQRCLTHGLWAGLSRQMHTYLSAISLADICKSEAKSFDQ